MSESHPTIFDILETLPERQDEAPLIRSSTWRVIACAALTILPTFVIVSQSNQSENKMPTDTDLSVNYGG